MGRVIAGTALCCAAGLLAACSTPDFTMPPGPAEYRVGFKDGCDSGYAYAGSPFYPQNGLVQAPSPKEPYVSGWYAGFAECKDNFQRIQRTVFVVLGPP
jgi:hypothetical protein